MSLNLLLSAILGLGADIAPTGLRGRARTRRGTRHEQSEQDRQEQLAAAAAKRARRAVRRTA